jgi:hypothetical protein
VEGERSITSTSFERRLMMNFEPIPVVDVVDRLFAVLDAADEDCVVYVYRVERDGTLRKPYSLKCPPAPDLVKHVQRCYGAGEYKFIIRRGRTMVCSAQFAIAGLIARS